MVYVYDNLGKKIQINYEIIGEGKPIVMVHGLACDMNLMKGCMEPVFEKVEGYKRLYLDLPGMGKSESAEELASSDKMMEVLLSFIKSTISGNFLIVGESYGGYLVRGILSVIMDRIEGMALICPVIFPENEDRILNNQNLTTYATEIYMRLMFRIIDSIYAIDSASTQAMNTRFLINKFLKHIKHRYYPAG